MKDVGFSPADILLPKEGIDMERWAVVACDQFTSQKEYWEEADRIAGDSPSTLRMILPECYLEESGKEERIQAVDRTMEEYLRNGIFREMKDCFILVKRDTGSGTRYGLVGKLDLEKYDYSPSSVSPIRATEGTILSRIPPRKEIRKNAMLELPHIMVLISDSRRSVIEPIAAKREALEKVYDSPLMLGGGHVEGYRVSSEEDKAAINSALAAISDSLDPLNPLLFAMGDGNHSLAAAKSAWEDIKRKIGKDREHPARYALVEIENIFDPGLLFEPIHRAFFSIDQGSFDDILSHHAMHIEKEKAASLEDAIKDINRKKQSFVLLSAGDIWTYTLDGTKREMPAWTIQSVIDEMLSTDRGSVDYIHGVDAVASLAVKGALGIILPDISKETFFRSILSDKAFPRKTFSIGHAEEKRYYIEARRIR